MNRTNWDFMQNAHSSGSALILAVVLTSMLAIVGVLFVMMARVDKIATSAISENRELDLAIESVIARISQQLVSDIPGIAGQEYYDSPDDNNAWLASLEPELYDDMGTLDPNDDVYIWRQISDVWGFLRNRPFPFATQFVNVDPSGSQDVIREYCQIILDPNGQLDRGLLDDGKFHDEWRGQLADVDGDGIADSKWVELGDVSSSKGERIYAAVRVVDLNAMLNVNTAFKFDPTDPCAIASHIDGSSQMQINLAGLAKPVDDINEIDAARCGFVTPVYISLDWRAFQQDVIWRTEVPASGYLPFDISDELELRYRYCITSQAQTRLENVWDNTIGLSLSFKDEPYAGGTFGTLLEWKQAVTDPSIFDSCRRHLLTTYNMDRIIDPKGGKMIDINDVDNLIGTPHERYSQILPLYFLDMNTPAGILYDRLLSSLVIVDPNVVVQYAQLAANITDFSDDDDINNDGLLDVGCVTTLVDPYDPCIIHYGLEAQPFINEIAWRISPSPADNLNFFALELCNPFNVDIDLGDFVLEFVNRNNPADQYSIGFLAGELIAANGYIVIVSQAGQFVTYNDPNTPMRVLPPIPALKFFDNWIEAEFDKSKPPIDRRPDPDKSKPPIPQGGWGNSYDVSLLRSVLVPVIGTQIYVDNQAIDPNWAGPGSTRAFGRDDREWRVVYQTPVEDVAYGGSLGIANYRHIPPASFPVHFYSFFLPNPLNPPASFITVGDIPRILTLGHGTIRNSTVGRQLMAFEQLEISTAVDQERNVRLDVQNPLYRNVFQYLTVFDPNSDNIDNDADGFVDESDGSEWKVPGRININTAPWYVLAQLPWVSAHTPNYELARAIVDHRNVAGAFGSIGELNFVGVSDPNNALRSIGYYARTDGPQLGDLLGFPDLTFGDGVEDDFEERDVIFSRISNLVTVRSDVFTAYILVRIGADGPQKRAVAILDRSGVNKMNFSLPDGKVRIVALQYVPDPR